VNPVSEGDELALCVNEDDPTISIQLAIETAPYFDISKKAAEAVASEIVLTVRDNWEKLAEKYGFSRSAIERMRPAFAECYQAEF
jgi:serine/threonine-protein kinase HipA